jgi:multicomponent Na+:H+ antiporter subunit D
MLGGLALCGLPPFGTYVGKSLAEDAMTKGGYDWGGLVFVLVSAMTGAAVLRAGLRVFYGAGAIRRQRDDRGGQEGESEDPETHGRQTMDHTPPQLVATIVVLLVGGLAAGVAPHVASIASDAGHRVLDGADYARQVLHLRAAAPLPREAVTPWTGKGLVLGLLSTLLALIVAVASVYSDRLPRVAERLGAMLASPLRGLRTLHSGHLGDYVAWLVTGVAGLAALVGLPLA